MAIMKINKSNHAFMSTYHLTDKNLSLAAKGLLCELFLHPNDWNCTAKVLASLNKESEKTISIVIKELEEHGYLVRTRTKGKNGLFNGQQWEVYEIPQNKKSN